MKAIHIEWDVDAPEELDGLPTEIEIPESLTAMDEISDYLSNETGFCHKGFDLTGVHTYDIFVDDLPDSSLVGNNGEAVFHSEEDAIADAISLIETSLCEEYGRKTEDFRIQTYES